MTLYSPNSTVLTTIVFFETGEFFAVIGCAERVATILRNNTRFRLTFFREGIRFLPHPGGLPSQRGQPILCSFPSPVRFSALDCCRASISAPKRSILMRSSLLALEEAVDFLDAPEAFPLICRAEPCMSVQC